MTDSARFCKPSVAVQIGNHGPAVRAGHAEFEGGSGQPRRSISTSVKAPGSWIEIYGSNLGVTSRSFTNADFQGINAPVSLDGTTVTIGGQAAFPAYVSPNQVNVQVSSNVGAGPQPVIVTTPSGASAPYIVNVTSTQFGLLAPAAFSVGGKQNVVALFADGATYVLPPGAIPGVPSRRAKSGDTITFYGVGFGPVTPDSPAGIVVAEQYSDFEFPDLVRTGGRPGVVCRIGPFRHRTVSV